MIGFPILVEMGFLPELAGLHLGTCLISGSSSQTGVTAVCEMSLKRKE